MTVVGSAWRSARYRAYQFLAGLRPILEADDAAEVSAVLEERGLGLFVAMDPRDRRHSLAVMRWLRRHGSRDEHPSRDLLEAALLHDVGKGRIWVWERVAFVLLDALPRAVTRHIESSSGGGFRHALWTLRHHAELGAQRLEVAGARPRVVELVRRHTERPADVSDDPELARLVEADANN